MSTKHIRTGADVCRFGCSVKVECGHCAAARTLSGMEWVIASGAGSLDAARARLKCGRCGRKVARVVVLSPD
jgi:hypothetical protein